MRPFAPYFASPLLVRPVYLLRLPTMTTNDQVSRGSASTTNDQIGKVFVVLAQDVRRCLICDGVFTRQGAILYSQPG
jgi:hypothetical protein